MAMTRRMHDLAEELRDAFDTLDKSGEDSRTSCQGLI
jgi:hypothetical protein